MFDRPNRPNQFDVVRLTRDDQPMRRAVPVSDSEGDYRAGQASVLLVFALMVALAIYLGASWIYGLISPVQHHEEATTEAPVEPATQPSSAIIPVAIVASVPPHSVEPIVAAEGAEAAIIEPVVSSQGEEIDPVQEDDTEVTETFDETDIIAANMGAPTEGMQMARFELVYPERSGTPDQQAIEWLAQGHATLEVATARGEVTLRVTRASPVQFELLRSGTEGETGSAMVLNRHPIDHTRIGLALADLLQSTEISESRIRFMPPVFAMIWDAQERALAALAAAGNARPPEALEIEVCLDGQSVGLQEVRELSSGSVLLDGGECR
jgi:hypothetical protein